MNTRTICAAAAAMLAVAASAKADCCVRVHVTFESYDYRALKPLMKQIDFALVPVERAIDRLCYPVELQKRMMQVDEDAQHVGALMIARETPTEEMRRQLIETYREVQEMRAEIRCYDLRCRELRRQRSDKDC
jgi:hypothetical protein